MKYTLEYIDWLSNKVQECHKIYKAYLIKKYVDKNVSDNDMSQHSKEEFNKIMKEAEKAADEYVALKVYKNELYTQTGEELMDYWNIEFGSKFEMKEIHQRSFEEILELSKKLNKEDYEHWVHHYAQFIAKISLAELTIISELMPNFEKWEDKFETIHPFESEKFETLDSIDDEYEIDGQHIVDLEEDETTHEFQVNYDHFTIQQIREELELHGIEHDHNSGREDLLSLLKTNLT